MFGDAVARANEEVALLTGMHTDKVEKRDVLPYLVALRGTSLLPLLQQQKPSNPISTSLSRNSKAHHGSPDVLQPMACHLASSHED